MGVGRGDADAGGRGGEGLSHWPGTTCTHAWPDTFTASDVRVHTETRTHTHAHSCAHTHTHKHTPGHGYAHPHTQTYNNSSNNPLHTAASLKDWGQLDSLVTQNRVPRLTPSAPSARAAASWRPSPTPPLHRYGVFSTLAPLAWEGAKGRDGAG
jgi:hypothetical protein